MTWQVQEAKNKLSQVIDDSLAKGPQIISRRGKNTVVMISYEDYQRLRRPAPTLQDIGKRFRGLEIPRIERQDAMSHGRGTAPNFDIFEGD